MNSKRHRIEADAGRKHVREKTRSDFLHRLLLLLADPPQSYGILFFFTGDPRGCPLPGVATTHAQKSLLREAKCLRVGPAHGTAATSRGTCMRARTLRLPSPEISRKFSGTAPISPTRISWAGPSCQTRATRAAILLSAKNDVDGGLGVARSWVSFLRQLLFGPFFCSFTMREWEMRKWSER